MYDLEAVVPVKIGELDCSGWNGIFETIPEVIEFLVGKFTVVSELHLVVQGPDKYKLSITPIVSTHEFILQEITFRELADRAKSVMELETYDFALPHEWCVDVKNVTGNWPSGFVWGYKQGAFGFPVPLTPKALALLETYTAKRS